MFLREQEQKDKMQIAQLQQQFAYYQEKLKDEEKVRSVYHDMKNHLIVLRNYEKEKEWSKLHIYLEDISRELMNTSSHVWTGNMMIDLILNQKSIEAREKGIKMNILTVPVSGFPCTDREIISLFGNLLDNAIKYSRDEVKIDIICESEKGFSKIKICDNGLGIPVKDLSRIFNRFERSVAAARSSKGGATGFGLGLNYVQQVMLAHEGRVEVESEEGRFSEFTLYFPVRE